MNARTHARTRNAHTHTHSRISSPSQGRRTRQHCVSRMQHSPERGNTPTKGSFPRGTTTPTHHTCTLALTLTQFYARPATRGSQALLIGGATPKRDGIGGANGRLSAACDWAFCLVALNPSALSKAVPASSSSTPPCVPQYPSSQAVHRVLRSLYAAEYKTARLEASVFCWTRPRRSQARRSHSQAFLDDVAILVDFCFPFYRGLPISVRACSSRGQPQGRQDETGRDETRLPGLSTASLLATPLDHPQSTLHSLSRR